MQPRRFAVSALLFGAVSVLSILLLSPAPKGAGVPSQALMQERAREMARERGKAPLIERFLDGGTGNKEEAGQEAGYAWEFFEHWYGTRAYPSELIPKSAFFDAWTYAQAENKRALKSRTAWTSIGPVNIGGRMLSLAIDPSDHNIIWAGAASGGLWRSTSAAEGASAWTLVETGYPTLSVSAIAIDPTDPNVMYIGTGEIGRYVRPQVGTPGARASYGIGLLKSVDRGVTWQQAGLTWTMDQHRAIMSLRIDQTDPLTVWAATSEGLYKSTDRGDNWTLSHASLMAMDVVLDPQDHNIVFVAHGQLNSTVDPGIYRSLDGGSTWTKLAGGLPTTNFGRCPLAIAHTAPSGSATVWAGTSDANTRAGTGLYKSTNGGDTWTKVSTINWCSSQAWYDNVIGVSPYNANLLLCGGLDWYRSTTGGPLTHMTYWYNGDMGVIPPGGPEGTADYVHADQHALAFDPVSSSIVYVGCDGGIFKSTNQGATWAGKNGGLVTTQIYSGFAGGYTTPDLAVGGLQDNGTIRYTGETAWEKIFGGDGGWCAIDPTNEAVIYEEYVYLNMYKSYDGGQNWDEVHAQTASTESNFIAPFVLCESAPNILYCGGLGIEKTTDGGVTWFNPDGNTTWNGTPMAIIGVSFTSPDTLLAATGSGSTGAVVEIRRSVDGGVSWQNVTAGLPVRYPTDFGYDRADSRRVWLTFSGYGTAHVYRSLDAGLTWEDRSGDLPDIPVQSVAVDPVDHDWVYLGTDLGVFMTTDGGGTWSAMGEGMPQAMILDLVIYPADRLMRAATFGNGVYQVTLPAWTSGVVQNDAVAGGGADLFMSTATWPNPFRSETSIKFRLAREAQVRCGVFDVAGRCLKVLSEGHRPAGQAAISWDGRDEAGARLAAGTYFVRLTAGAESKTEKVVLAP